MCCTENKVKRGKKVMSNFKLLVEKHQIHSISEELKANPLCDAVLLEEVENNSISVLYITFSSVFSKDGDQDE